MQTKADHLVYLAGQIAVGAAGASSPEDVAADAVAVYAALRARCPDAGWDGEFVNLFGPRGTEIRRPVLGGTPVLAPLSVEFGRPVETTETVPLSAPAGYAVVVRTPHGGHISVLGHGLSLAEATRSANFENGEVVARWNRKLGDWEPVK